MSEISYIDFIPQIGGETIVDTSRLVPGKLVRLDAACAARMGALIASGMFWPYILTVRESSISPRHVEYDVSINILALELLE